MARGFHNFLESLKFPGFGSRGSSDAIAVGFFLCSMFCLDVLQTMWQPHNSLQAFVKAVVVLLMCS